MLGPPGSTRQYWEHIKDTEFFKQHPLLHDLDHTIPIGMHGDGGAYSKQDSVLAISWNSIITPSEKGGRIKRIVFTMIRKSD